MKNKKRGGKRSFRSDPKLSSQWTKNYFFLNRIIRSRNKRKNFQLLSDKQRGVELRKFSKL
jgi:hypothetical protein